MEKVLLFVHKVVSYFEGKKAMITAAVGAISAFLSQQGIISPELNSLVASLLLIANGGAVGVGTTQAYKDNKSLGKI